ncbi:MAG TPA: S41 family peptidase [Anaeromyxobacteraceae bacterium]|nr:S41 family peptidase [Anaeromyxobacteraceae bacterium]
MRRVLAALAASLALASCGSDECSVGKANQFVHQNTLDWYLYPELLPDPLPDPARYADPQDLLDALTANARAAGMDRGWSYVASYSAVTAYYAGGPTAGFGFSLQIRGTGQLFLTQVMTGSAAAAGGFHRGDEILSISDVTGILAQTPFTSESISAAIGPATAGVTRTFEVAPVEGGTATRTVTKAAYTLVPVSHAVIDRGVGVPKIGYVNLVTFITPAEAQLREAFAAFQADGVQDVIVDLRYNGGGLVDTAIVLANLLGGGRTTNDTMFAWYLNPAHLADTPPPQTFAPEAGSISVRRVAFVTTGASASASELVANVMEPWVPVAIVGARTYGKPVGQRGFVLQSCDLLLGLIAFGLENAQGDGAYFDGLPDAGGNFSGPLCAAADDLTLPMGNPLEASTAAALAFVDTGACPAPVAAAPALRTSLLRTSAGAVNPTAADPTPAQRDVAGLF